MLAAHLPSVASENHFKTKSGLRPWIDVNTPSSALTKTSSRGATWELVFSDEFNVAGRNFTAGYDYLWTALDLADGVNAALEYYSPNMTRTTTSSDGRGIFQIQTQQDEIKYRAYNAYASPPAYENHTMVRKKQ